MLKLCKLTSIRILALVGWLFIIAGLSGLGLGSKHSSTLNTSVVLKIWTDLPCSPKDTEAICLSGHLTQLKEIITFPRKPVLHQSTSLTVSIVPETSSTSWMPEVDQIRAVSRSVVVQHPSELLEAQLSASAFDVDPQKQLLQHFDHDTQELDFNWTITPNYTGKQTLIVTIIAPAPSNQQEGQVLNSNVMHIAVDDTANSVVGSLPVPSLNLGQITLGELLVILLGSCLNIPWIIELLQKRKETKEKEGKTELITPTVSTNISIPDVSSSPKSPEQSPST